MMNMKKWESPSVSELHVKDTHETQCDCGVVSIQGDVMTTDDKKHPCHKTGNGQHNDSGNHVAGVDQNGHVLSTGCPNTNHYDSEGNPICCCYKAGIQSNS